MISDTKVPAVEASTETKTKEIPPDMVLSVKRVAEAKQDTSDRIYRVYCDGIFDLFHVGHMKMLWQAKNALGKPDRTHLIVGVCTDEDTHKFKGKTVMTQEIRCESVRHCKWTDEVAEDAPWVITDSFIEKYQIDFVAHDALPYTDHSGSAYDSADVYAGVKRKGMFLETQRTEGISTSDLIVAIVRDYDDYIERNLKRGFSAEELNVGSSWWMRSVYHKKKKELKQSVEVTKDEYKALTDTARDFVKTFSPEGLQGSYVHKLKTNLPAPAKGIIHHAWGLTVASTQMTLHFLSYFNPFSYCRRKKFD